jgi:hypothetical protein
LIYRGYSINVFWSEVGTQTTSIDEGCGTNFFVFVKVKNTRTNWPPAITIPPELSTGTETHELEAATIKDSFALILSRFAISDSGGSPACLLLSKVSFQYSTPGHPSSRLVTSRHVTSTAYFFPLPQLLTMQIVSHERSIILRAPSMVETG